MNVDGAEWREVDVTDEVMALLAECEGMDVRESSRRLLALLRSHWQAQEAPCIDWRRDEAHAWGMDFARLLAGLLALDPPWLALVFAQWWLVDVVAPATAMLQEKWDAEDAERWESIN